MISFTFFDHTGQCKRTGGCYNELVVAFYSTGGGVLYLLTWPGILAKNLKGYGIFFVNIQRDAGYLDQF